jgi:hypothetical protein
VLTRRINEGDARQLIPASDWKFAKCSAAAPFPGTPDETSVCLKDKWDPAYLYELVYVAKDPKVMGLGLAALRDMITFFHREASDAAGTANPVAAAIRNTIASGVSQCGNFMKTFVNLGFNEDRAGRKVFDGVFAQIAARQTNINMRFAIPGGGGGVRTDHTAFGQAGTRGLSKDYVDDVAQRRGGILSRCEASGTCPKLFIGFSGTEFYVLQGSPLLTDAWGTADLVQPDNARIYYYASTHHLLGLPSLPGATAGALYTTNANTGVMPVVRALYQNLEEWVVKGTTPPDSQVPKLADATLVRPAQVKFPAIPGASYTGLVNTYSLLDWGPGYRPQDESGIATQVPPAYLGRDYAVLVPQVDADGNDIAGIRSLDVAVPWAPIPAGTTPASRAPSTWRGSSARTFRSRRPRRSAVHDRPTAVAAGALHRPGRVRRRSDRRGQRPGGEALHAARRCRCGHCERGCQPRAALIDQSAATCAANPERPGATSGRRMRAGIS